MKTIILTLLFALNAYAQPAKTPRLITMEHDKLQRSYLIYVPSSYSGDKPVPLLFVLHGAGDSMHTMAEDKYYWQISASEKYGHIVIFPNGGDAKDHATWNSGTCCGTARRSKIDDVGFIKKIIERVSSFYRIDSKRIYSTGMSNGGMLSYSLACELSDMMAGIAAVAGTDNTINCKPSRPVPILQIHAKDDDLVLFDSPSSRYTSVPATALKWKKLNGCTGEVKKVFEVPGAHCEEYADCTAGAKVRLCLTYGGKHSWPEKDRVPGQNASEAVSASDLMWDYFNHLSDSTQR